MSPASRRLWDSFSVPRSLLITYGLLKLSSSHDDENLFDGMHSSNVSHSSADPEPAGETCVRDQGSGLRSELLGINSAIDQDMNATQKEFCISDFLMDSTYNASPNIAKELFDLEDNQGDFLNNIF
jgi:hypothetical protein